MKNSQVDQKIANDKMKCQVLNKLLVHNMNLGETLITAGKYKKLKKKKYFYLFKIILNSHYNVCPKCDE